MKLPFDEVNELVRQRFASVDELENKQEDEIIDSLLELLIMSYVLGYGEDAPPSYVEEAIYLIINGETWEDRAKKHIENKDLKGIYTLMETESHRLFNSGATTKATEQGYTKKTWKTARDNNVRDSHEPLENITIDIDGYFTTFDGDMAFAPGDFQLAQNNCNCRCYLQYS